HYCHGNPVKLVDIDGLFDEFSPTAKDFDDAIDWIYDLPNQITKWVQSVFGEESAPKGGEHGYGDDRTGSEAVGPKAQSAQRDRDNTNFIKKLEGSSERGKGTPGEENDDPLSKKGTPEGMEWIPVYVEGESFVRKDGGIETPIIRKYDSLVTTEQKKSIYEKNGEYVIRTKQIEN
ncbi:MAG: hypothetical protein J5554_01160, partial [Paludibacteraceae bacterium]|nr:hypothetical protein [Paludibacteraceae bacterium]